MSNVKYDDYKPFNKHIKDEYLKQFKSEGTRYSVERVFKITSKSEYDYGKDLFQFTREQIRMVLFLFSPKTENSSSQNLNLIVRYIDWAIDNDYLEGINPLHGVMSDWHKQFVNTNLKIYWTDAELERIILKLTNNQDAIIIRLLFEGVKGTANSEIVNLHRNSLQPLVNELHLYDSITGVKRSITVSERCFKMCEAASKEIDYNKKNGNPSPDLRSSPTTKLSDSKFIIKSSKTRVDRPHEADKNIVHRRLAMISKEIEEQFFFPTNIFFSGMLFMAKELYLKNGKLEDEEYGIIFKQFGEESEQVQQRYREEVVNLENIKELYELS